MMVPFKWKLGNCSIIFLAKHLATGGPFSECLGGNTPSAWFDKAPETSLSSPRTEELGKIKQKKTPLAPMVSM